MGFKDVWLVMGVKEYLMTVRTEFNVQDYAPRTLCSGSIILWGDVRTGFCKTCTGHYGN